MKTRIIFSRLYVLMVAIYTICFNSFILPYPGSDVDKNVLKAYQLRLQGKVDEAKTLLEQVISKNQNDAYAYYELARTQLHQALGLLGPGVDFIGMIGDAQKSTDKAILLEPQNIIFQLFAGHLDFMQAFFGLMTGNISKEKCDKVIGVYKTILKINPDYHQAALYLIELYSQLPEEAGGNKIEAEIYAKLVEEKDSIYGAKARSILLPEGTDRVKFWQKVLEKHKGNVDVLEELGKAYLDSNKVDEAVSCFEDAIKTDSAKSYLFLDLSIYYTFRGMGARDNQKLLQSCVEKGYNAVTRYIDSNPINPMLAYAIGVQYKDKLFSGQQEEAQVLLKKAESLDPYFSKATGAPDPTLFISPGEISQRHRFLMRPF